VWDSAIVSALAAAYNGTVPAAPALAVMATGVVVAVLGHIWRSYRIVAVGVAILFLATALMLIGAFIAFKRGEKDPRPAPDFGSLVVR
jgi:type IV secretory pathway TrbD component